MSEQGIIEVPRLYELFIKGRPDERILCVICKIVEESLMAQSQNVIDEFHGNVSKRCEIGCFVIARDLILNSFHVHKSYNQTVQISMKEYLTTSKPLAVTLEQRKQFDAPCTRAELTAYSGLAGSLNFLGHGGLPQDSFLARFLQQAVGSLKVPNLLAADKLLQEIGKVEADRTFRSLKTLDASPSYLTFSDASQGSTPCGQTGYISGIYLPAGCGGLYHVIYWLSCRQTSVAFSAIGAEIPAAEKSAERRSMITEILQVEFSSEMILQFVLTVDCHSLFSTVTTMQEESFYLLHTSVVIMRDSFETGAISVMYWKPENGLRRRLHEQNFGHVQEANGRDEECIPEFRDFQIVTV